MALKSDLEAIKKAFQKNSGGTKKEDYFKVPNEDGGKAIVRIAGPWSKKQEPMVPWYSLCLHYGFKAGGYPIAIPCLERNLNNPHHQGACPVCDLAAAAKESGDKDLIKRLLTFPHNIGAQWFNYFNVFIREGKSYTGPKILPYSGKLIKLIRECAEDDEIGDITDPNTGFDIVITRSITGKKHSYSERVRRQSTKISYNSKDLHQLDKVIPRWRTLEEVEKLLRENYLEEMRELGLIEKPKRKKVKPVVKKKKRMVVEEVDDDDDIDYSDIDDSYTEDDD